MTSLTNPKGLALLAYLAVESSRPHPRQMLANLLWPDQPEAVARHNLSQTLLTLRQAIGDLEATPPFLLITRQTIQFNPASNYELDVTAFLNHLVASRANSQPELKYGPACLLHLQQAVDLYQGVFLAGFSLFDNTPFEEWSLLKREWLQRQVLEALAHLITAAEGQEDYPTALKYARRQTELEPSQEEGHRYLMRLLARSGQRSAALAQYESCRRLLVRELGVEPAGETVRLYEQIRAGALEQGPSARQVIVAPAVSFQPAISLFLAPPPPTPPDFPFVAREVELARLEEFLKNAVAGQGRVVFITGEAGSGKTALVQAFARQAQEAWPDLIVAGGSCQAPAGLGDSYLPFREMLGLLTGDVETRYTSGAISPEQARRLWALLPFSVRALLQAGPDLLENFISRAALINRITRLAAGQSIPRGPLTLGPADSSGASAPYPEPAWLAPLKRQTARRRRLNLPQSDLFEQYSQVLQLLARQQPLLLILEDLQWADDASVSLLFHLGRRLEGSQILLLGTYRTTEVALGHRPAAPGLADRHPLTLVIHQFRRQFGPNEVNLWQSEDRSFVERLLATEPNRLSPAFREALYQRTQGHPLFTVEMVRGMQERGDLRQDEAGCWVEGPKIDWETLPPRVEEVISECLDRLPASLRAALEVASVEGEEFTAEVVAQVQQINVRDLVRWLSSSLAQQHRLVKAQGSRRLEPGGPRLSRYCFRHLLFQKYLYNRLDEVERVYLHEAVGQVLEQLYGTRTETMAAQLARHFQAAGLIDKAVGYLLQAGNRVDLSKFRPNI